MDRKAIARERIGILLAQAKAELDTDAALSRRHVQLARAIGMRATVRLPREWKRRLCKGCSTVLVPGKTATVRARAGKKAMAVTCRHCGAVKRFPYGPRHPRTD